MGKSLKEISDVLIKETEDTDLPEEIKKVVSNKNIAESIIATKEMSREGTLTARMNLVDEILLSEANIRSMDTDQLLKTGKYIKDDLKQIYNRVDKFFKEENDTPKGNTVVTYNYWQYTTNPENETIYTVTEDDAEPVRNAWEALERYAIESESSTVLDEVQGQSEEVK